MQTRMHSTRMLIARLLPYLILSHVSQVRGGSAHLPLGRPGAGVCPTRPPGHVTCDACWGARIPTDFRHVDLLKDTEERAPEAGGDAGAREALSRHGRVGDQICKQREDE